VNLTFDHNLLIELESSSGITSEGLQCLVSLHDSGQITIRVSGIGASERRRGKTYAPNFSAFRERVSKLSQREFEILRPLGYWGITYWDWCLWSGEETPLGELDRKIHLVLFPRTEFSWQDYAKTQGVDPKQSIEDNSPEWQKWRNRKCDVLTMWCHIYYTGDIFVTNDKRFLGSRRTALINIGARNILNPGYAASGLAGS
jgi:hypothetical protein